MACRDGHPGDHASFAERGGDVARPLRARAPPGAELDARVAALRSARVVDKGDRADREAYSAFDGTGPRRRAARARGRARCWWAGSRPTTACARRRSTPCARASRSWSWRTRCAPSTSQAGDGERALAEVRDAGGSVAASGRLPVHDGRGGHPARRRRRAGPGVGLPRQPRVELAAARRRAAARPRARALAARAVPAPRPAAGARWSSTASAS